MQGGLDQNFVHQQLRSIVIHSLDNFNFKNAEFACERLLTLDSDNPDFIYLYALTLFRQDKFKSCYNKLADYLAANHLGCSYLFARSCLKLKKYKEGIYQLLKIAHLYNELSIDGDNCILFTTPQQRYYYEFQRPIYPDSSTIYHLLGNLYKGIGDIKNSCLNYGESLKYNQFNFEAFQELCRLGADVKIKSIFKSNNSFNTQLANRESEINSNPNIEFSSISNPFSVSATGETPTIHPDDTFNNALSTPRVKPTSMPEAPLRKSNINANRASSNQFEFAKPNHITDSVEKKSKRESAYSRITSRLISQPSNNAKSNEANASLKKPNIRANLKRNIASSLISNSRIDSHPSHISLVALNEIEDSSAYLLKHYMTFAKAFKSLSKYDCYKAIRILESLPEKEKETPWVLSKLGRLHYEIVNYKQSEYFFVKLRKLDRTRLEDMEYYSTLLWHLQKKVELTYLANELHDLDSNSPITWCTIGNLFSLNREPDEAIKCFNKSIKLDEDFTYAYTLKGHEYFSNDNYEMALENFRLSLLIDPRHYNALYGIGMVYINLGEYQKADYHFRKAVSINPINVILICCVGMVMEKLGKKTLALRQYELANKLQPLNPLPIFKKAQLLFSMQQFTQALRFFETLRELAPDEASVHFLLGQLYNIQNDKFLAIREFTIALNLDPKGNYLIREAMQSLKD